MVAILKEIAIGSLWTMLIVFCISIIAGILLEPFEKRARDKEQDEKMLEIAKEIYMKFADKAIEEADKDETTENK